MIISASRRTDIPAFYFDWFFNRLREGYVITRNPMNPKQVKRIDLSADSVDGIVFWTKNAAPMLAHLQDVAEYPYYVQFTITAYGPEIEPGLPDKGKHIIPTFQRLSEAIGARRVIWRYDPIFIGENYPVDAHNERFFAIANILKGYTETCVLSFLDMYGSIQKKAAKHGIRTCSEREMHSIAKTFAEIAGSAGIRLQTCAEAIDLDAYGITHGQCVDAILFEEMTGKKCNAKKDKNQRPACGCAESVDIGAYNTCANGCVYCYANHASALVAKNRARFDAARECLIE